MKADNDIQTQKKTKELNTRENTGIQARGVVKNDTRLHVEDKKARASEI